MNKKSPLDLNKLFPEYFNKNVFRGVLILMVCLLVFTYWSNDWEYKFVYAYCPEDSGDGCLLETGTLDFDLGSDVVIPENVLIPSGSYYGNPPNIHAQKFNSRSYLLIFLGFIINHLLYYFKTGNFKPEVNKKSLKKIKKLFNEVEINERK